MRLIRHGLLSPIAELVSYRRRAMTEIDRRLSPDPSLGWPIALSLLVAAPLLALVVWLPQLKKHEHVNLSGPKQAPTVAVWRSPLA